MKLNLSSLITFISLLGKHENTILTVYEVYNLIEDADMYVYM